MTASLKCVDCQLKCNLINLLLCNTSSYISFTGMSALQLQSQHLSGQSSHELRQKTNPRCQETLLKTSERGRDDSVSRDSWQHWDRPDWRVVGSDPTTLWPGKVLNSRNFHQLLNLWSCRNDDFMSERKVDVDDSAIRVWQMNLLISLNKRVCG